MTLLMHGKIVIIIIIMINSRRKSFENNMNARKGLQNFEYYSLIGNCVSHYFKFNKKISFKR